MPWYVFALTDSPLASPGKGLRGPIAFRPIGSLFAAAERRADVPPVELGSLRAHQQIVERLAAGVPAILPVRFGTLLSSEEIEEALADRDEELSDALAFVRGRRQMTWRLRTRRRGGRRSTPRDGRLIASSGADYLRQAMRAARPAPPRTFKRIADSVGRLAVAERYQQPAGAIPDALYHLVEGTRVESYASASRRLLESVPALVLSGPWAPYAFVPEPF
jgi:hypothetical protein